MEFDDTLLLGYCLYTLFRTRVADLVSKFLSYSFFKGTVSRDFRPTFFALKTPPGRNTKSKLSDNGNFALNNLLLYFISNVKTVATG